MQAPTNISVGQANQSSTYPHSANLYVSFTPDTDPNRTGTVVRVATSEANLANESTCVKVDYTGNWSDTPQNSTGMLIDGYNSTVILPSRNTNYYYKLATYIRTGEYPYTYTYSDWSDAHTFLSLPAAPTNFALVEYVEGGATFSWTGVGVDRYQISWQYDDMDADVDNISASPYSCNHLFVPGAYDPQDVWVRAVNSSGWVGDWSAPVSNIYVRPPTIAITVSVNPQGKATASTTYQPGSCPTTNGDEWIFYYLYDAAGNLISSAASNTYYNNNHQFTGLTPGVTYKINARVRDTANGTWIWSLAYSNTVTFVASSPPDDFIWWTPKVSEGRYGMEAAEWNAFTTRLNEFRAYINETPYSFTAVATGDDFTSGIFKESYNALHLITVPNHTLGNYSAVKRGDRIYASYLNNIVQYMNGIRDM
ncbi:MAG: hypothetical protein CVU90_02055 [Firmicutes bacterium HGW-Firmicutes-15]|nr:MAG: hypothetical protein CVU90_02055 [Firmicutes bacterium HGW-Firmicutes-15]